MAGLAELAELAGQRDALMKELEGERQRAEEAEGKAAQQALAAFADKIEALQTTSAPTTRTPATNTTSPPLAKLESRPKPRALTSGTTTSFMNSSMM